VGNLSEILIEQQALKEEVWSMDLPDIVDEIGFIMTEYRLDKSIHLILLKYFEKVDLLEEEIESLKLLYILVYCNNGVDA